MIEFVDSDLYFVQDKNNFINPLLQVGSGSGSGSGRPKITGSGSSSLLQRVPLFETILTRLFARTAQLVPHPCHELWVIYGSQTISEIQFLDNNIQYEGVFLSR